MSPQRWQAGGPGPGDLETLDGLAASLADLVGFRLAIVNLVDGEDMVVAAGHGFELARRLDGSLVGREEILGTRWAAARLDPLLALGEDWGGFVFISHERRDEPRVERWFTTDSRFAQADGAWHRDDALIGPVYDVDGTLIACISLDDPTSGLLPNEAARGVLARWSAYAAAVIRDVVERGRLATRARRLAPTREVLDRLSEAADPHALLSEIQGTVAAAFDADGLVVQIFGDDDRGSGSDFVSSDIALEAASTGGWDPVVAWIEELARRTWSEQRALILSLATLEQHPDLGEEAPRLAAWMRYLGVDEVLYAPLGAGPTVVGSMMITRGPGRAGWDEQARRDALELGHDIGQILHAGRARRREHQLVRELRAVDDYRHSLVATLSHELTNPLSAIVGYAELLADQPDRPERRTIEAIARTSRRMARVVDDFLLLSRVSDPDQGLQAAPVALDELVQRVAGRTEPAATAAGLTLTVRTVPCPPVAGDAAELERAVRSLVGNAVRYTPAGGDVVLLLRPTAAGVELSVTDTGIGIPHHELGDLFREFVRGASPGVTAHPGSGLGLALADRIVRRHGGAIRVESSPGWGSTFRVLLPASHPGPARL